MFEHSLVIRDGDKDVIDAEERRAVRLLECQGESRQSILYQADDADGLNRRVDLCCDRHDRVGCRHRDIDSCIGTGCRSKIEREGYTRPGTRPSNQHVPDIHHLMSHRGHHLCMIWLPFANPSHCSPTSDTPLHLCDTLRTFPMVRNRTWDYNRAERHTFVSLCPGSTWLHSMTSCRAD